MAALAKLVGTVAVGVAVAGCGSGGHVGGHLDVHGQTTPADAVNMSVSIIGNRVMVSPTEVGSGQLIFNISSSDGRSQKLMVRSLRDAVRDAGLSTIPANGTAQVKVDLKPGRYLIGSADTGETALESGSLPLKAATLTVEPARGGGDSAVEQP